MTVRTPPYRQIRARFDETTVTVYQAYSSAIADVALAAGRFVPPFKLERMTWVKPSFLWMMYRSGWATKAGQERVLAIDLDRNGFEWALAHGSLSHYDRNVHPGRDAWQAEQRTSCVRVQWDPERSITLGALSYRSIQIGLGGDAVPRYVGHWITAITDVTELAHQVHALVSAGRVDEALAALPQERPYPLAESIAARLGASAAPRVDA